MKCILLVEHVRERLGLLLLVCRHRLLVQLLRGLYRGGAMRSRMRLPPLLTTLLRCLLCYLGTPFLLSRLLGVAILGIVMEINCPVRLASQGGLKLFLHYCGSLRVLRCLLVKYEGFFTVLDELVEFLLRVKHAQQVLVFL